MPKIMDLPVVTPETGVDVLGSGMAGTGSQMLVAGGDLRRAAPLFILGIILQGLVVLLEAAGASSSSSPS